MVDNIMDYHFKNEQKGIFDGEIKDVEMFSCKYPIAWININGVVHAAVPMSAHSINGILFPIEESEEYLRHEYKEKYDIDIPKNVHQWPFKKTQGR